ncbi:hypothetical protein BCM02_104247 [Paenibacillus methanolicus]|uniref:Uncharacterized protein n=1 Tax=Paenibacillus methanolicus TaxID=582686 RepID=A0A5S5CAB4_9BACL|nr:hypothetical protein BCM02_104247 [Paenibacillus methanolicus]
MSSMRRINWGLLAAIGFSAAVWALVIVLIGKL